MCEDGDAFARLLEDERRNAILVGPGSGVGERTHNAALAALATHRPVVLDADAITVFAKSPAKLFAAIQGQALLTPHEGEFRRLFPDLVGDPRARSSALARRRRLSGATVLLKGPDTVIAAPDGRAVINVHASPGLATAGAGDVLAGIAAGLMAQGLSAFAAAAAAAWLHGDCALRFRPAWPHRRGSGRTNSVCAAGGTSSELTVWPARARSSGQAGVVKLVDTRDLGSRAARRGGSSPSARTRCQGCPGITSRDASANDHRPLRATASAGRRSHPDKPIEDRRIVETWHRARALRQ